MIKILLYVKERAHINRALLLICWSSYFKIKKAIFATFIGQLNRRLCKLFLGSWKKALASILEVGSCLWFLMSNLCRYYVSVLTRVSCLFHVNGNVMKSYWCMFISCAYARVCYAIIMLKRTSLGRLASFLFISYLTGWSYWMISLRSYVPREASNIWNPCLDWVACLPLCRTWPSYNLLNDYAKSYVPCIASGTYLSQASSWLHLPKDKELVYLTSFSISSQRFRRLTLGECIHLV